MTAPARDCIDVVVAYHVSIVASGQLGCEE